MANNSASDQNKLTRKHMKRIKPSQARRGIYLDFEGFKDKSPAVVGILKDDQFRQIVLDSHLRSAAEFARLDTVSLGDVIKQLYEECETEKRFMIAFSEHEMNVVFRDCGIDISRRYKNARTYASRWASRYGKNSVLERHSLEEFLKLPEVDYNFPENLPKGNATRWLRAVSDGLAKRGDFASLTSTQKGHWERLLEYNRHDVYGLRALTLRVSAELKR